MNEYIFRGWTFDPLVILAIAAGGFAYARFIGKRGRPVLFAFALVLLGLTLLSPLSLLANGVLFSAHMTQHILLLLFIPGLILLSLPSGASLASAFKRGSGRTLPGPALTVISWALGVGSMWFWHIPQLCDAAATTPLVHGVQTFSLLGMGAAFWWPILAPSAADRLLPGHGIAYLFTACLACTGLGILLTLTPVEVCSAFSAPTTAPANWAALRDQLGARRDQQVGGLLMWLPMCLVYVAAIVLELGRWLAGRDETLLRTARETHS